MDEVNNDDMSVSDLVDNIASTIGNDQGKADVTPDTAGADGQTASVAGAEDTANVDIATEDKKEEQPKVGEDGKPIEPNKGQELDPIIDQAIEYIEKLTGKKLSDTEALVEMSKSVVNSTAKHQQDAEDIKDLAERNKVWEDWYNTNKIEEIISIYQDPRVQRVIDEIKTGVVKKQDEDLGLYDEIPPAVQKRLDAQDAELAKYRNTISSKEQAEKQQALTKQQAEYTKTIEEFAKNNPDYKSELDIYAERCKLNPYAKLPEKLVKWDKMVRSGVDVQDAWDVINKDKLATKIQEEISKKQEEKVKSPRVLPKSGQKPPVKSYEETNDFEDFWGSVIERAGQNSR